jgi:phosphoglycolate phosphatase-like HAD superfamily hydrolase
MALDVSRIKGLCFDVDGTLRDTDDQWVERLANALHPLEFVFPKRDYRRLARRMVMTSDDPVNAAMHLTDRLGLDNLAVRLMARRAPVVPPRSTRLPPTMIAGVREMLQRLYERFPMAVVSARGEHGTLAFLDGHGLTELFKVVVTGQTCRFTKPFPDPVQYAAEVMGFPPENCLMVGDTIVDIMSGKSAGAQTVGVLCGFGEEPELRQRGADLILETTARLADVLLGRRNLPDGDAKTI